MARLLFSTEEERVAATRQQLEAVSCNPALLTLAFARSVLLLQGPVGPFFDRLAGWLQRYGKAVHRVAFHPGDVADSRVLTPIPYTGTTAAWRERFEQLLRELRIDAVVLFGQSRPHHQAARAVCALRGIPAVVMEEGYIRPGFATMELDGVNAESSTLDRFVLAPAAPGPVVTTVRPPRVPGQFRRMARHACFHYWQLYWKKPLSADYEHHRATDIWFHTRYWIRSGLRKQLNRVHDQATVQSLAGRPYYFVPLQYDGDTQITHHSQYPRVTTFVEEVIGSFAGHAPADALLVLKTHPHARGGPCDGRRIAALAAANGIDDRVVHLVEGHTPTLVRNARGVVLVNSTVGVQAIARCKPLAVLGDAIYKRPGLHHAGPLETFWTRGSGPDASQAQAFLQQLIGLTQVPCDLYGAANAPLDWTIEVQPRGRVADQP
jgi:capsular polysaccharide export protein